jgi:hypothetical protein
MKNFKARQKNSQNETDNDKCYVFVLPAAELFAFFHRILVYVILIEVANYLLFLRSGIFTMPATIVISPVTTNIDLKPYIPIK